MTFNLLDNAWISVRRQGGSRESIRPAQIAETDDPPVSLASPRPDFDGALAQFLIGLLQTTFAPEDDEDWEDLLLDPPSVKDLDRAFAKMYHAFNLAGEGPRFMQDYHELGTTPSSIGSLLIEAPGDNTLRNNADHFIKRGHVDALCPTCAATALFALQINAPTGGAGHRTSLRGGGPLTTLIQVDPHGSSLNENLWTNIFMNVLPKTERLSGNWEKSEARDIFPWLAPTRTSEKGKSPVTPEDVNPLQMYWCMPRRIRLDWANTDTGNCGICGMRSDNRIRQYITVNYGINYKGPWRHPLTPYIHNKKGEMLPMHPQSGGITYRYWLNLTYRQMEDGVGVEPAQVLDAFCNRNQSSNEQQVIQAFGYDMDNMKARCWYKVSLPLYLVPSAIRDAFVARVNALIETAQYTAGQLHKRLKEAWLKRPSALKTKVDFFVPDAFYQHTEGRFFSAIDRLLEALPEKEEIPILHQWYVDIRRAALELFDEWALSGDTAWSDPERISRARSQFLKDLSPRNRRLRSWLLLDLAEEEVA